MKPAFLTLVLVLAAGCGADEQPAPVAEPARPSPPAAVAPPPAAAAKPPPATPKAPRPDPVAPAQPEPTPDPEPSPTPVEPASPASSEPDCEPGKVHAVGDQSVAFAAVARRPLVARRSPNGRRFESFDTRNVNGHATVFRVRGVSRDSCGPVWYYAALPVRPNGVAGFIMARDVRIVKVQTRITVDLSKRELVLYREGEKALRSPVAIGAAGTPTPTGRYYVNQRLIASDPSGPWGPGAVGISAFSDVLQEWIQGGPIAIHGTNDPSSIGHAVSHGCVRLPNDVLRKVFNSADAGTPVIIQT